MRDSVPSASYSSVCNVLRQWNIPLIPTYRVYRLYDMGHCFCVGLIFTWVTTFVWVLYPYGSLLLYESYIHKSLIFIWVLYSYGSYIHMGHYSEDIVHVIVIHY